jgi:predicted Rossmann-fold nucleotide-binding protein
MEYGKPDQLYTSDDLLRGYDRGDKLGFIKSWDFSAYQTYVRDGSATPASIKIRLGQAEHDAHVAEALKAFLTGKGTPPKLVGIMGGHSLSRLDPAYLAVARLGQHLTQQGYMVVTGGGPGAMEAAHVGATFSAASADQLEIALKSLGGEAKLPKGLDGILTETGDLGPGYEDLAAQAGRWLDKALEVRDTAPGKRGDSLAIPTWVYGSEPSTPFATAYAKYFQNSIREEALVTQSRAGIVYAQGGGGTLREIFEDAEQNYYAKTSDDFTPMIFFDPDNFWEHNAQFDRSGMTGAGINVRDFIEHVFRYARTDTKATLRKVKFTTNFNVIDQILAEHAHTAQKNLAFALASTPRSLA